MSNKKKKVTKNDTAVENTTNQQPEENESKETSFKRNTQSRSWTLCFNNIEETGYNLEKICQIISTDFPSLRYYCASEEIGLEEKKLHAHAYIYTANPIRFSTIKGKFPDSDVHVEESYGSPVQNREYVFKNGKWAEDCKADTRIDGRQFEWGYLPQGKCGGNSDEELLISAIKNGWSNCQILNAMPEIALIRYHDIDRIRLDFTRDKFTNTRRLNLKVNYLFGATGTGKTRGALDEYGDACTYRVTDYQHPFDGYDCTRHSVIIFDEFRSSLKLQDMLQYLDIYPIDLPCRYSNKFAAYTTVFIISNEPFEKQYPEYVSSTDPDKQRTYEAWKRRINGYVREYMEDGTTKEWATLNKYLSERTVAPQIIPSLNQIFSVINQFNQNSTLP